jgi:hypothetical protein
VDSAGLSFAAGVLREGWFKQAPAGAILRLERAAPGHLRCPDLDVDLAIDSIEHPERYPLKSKI